MVHMPELRHRQQVPCERLVTRALMALFILGVAFIFTGCALVWPTDITLCGLGLMAPAIILGAISAHVRSHA